MLLELRSLLSHMSRYSLGSIITMLSGIVTFAILTRSLPIDEYGRLSLITVTITLVVAIAKLGMSHATVRFYAAHSSPDKGSFFHSTVIVTALVAGIAFGLGTAAISWGMESVGWIDGRARYLLQFAAVAILLRVIFRAAQNVLRAEERSGAFAVMQSLERIIWLITIAGIAVTVGLTLDLTVMAMVFCDALIVIVAVVLAFRKCDVRISKFSPRLLHSMLVYGIPLLGMEVAELVHQSADRYVISGLIGSSPVGVYSAAYTLAEYINNIIFLPASLALLPMIFRIHNEKGDNETERFLNRSVELGAILLPAIVAGLAATAYELLMILSGPSYAEGANIVPVTVVSLCISASLPVFAASMEIGQQTGRIFLISAAGAVMDLGLNFLLIPRVGIIGAALSTLVSYAAILAITIRLSRPVKVAIPWQVLGKYSLVATVMYVSVMAIEFSNAAMTLAARVVVGMLIYGISVFILEKDLRSTVERLRAEKGPAT